MIWCVSFSEISAHLGSLGFDENRRTEFFVAFLRQEDRKLFTIRPPNVAGYLPETIVEDAFASARLPRPEDGWNVFFSD